MAFQLRDRVPALAGVLTLLSLALVFGAVLGHLPGSLLPRFDALIELIPHLNAAISVLAIASILLGVIAIREGDIPRHRRAMLTTTGLFALFLVFYLYRLTLEGQTVFAGPSSVRQFVYLPILGVHILLAIICLPFVYLALLFAWTHPVAELPATPHARVGRLAASLWLVSFALGLCVYLLLYIIY